ncbi:MAG: phospho-N-acetylmuramoyl-pentapeptide-transferase [Bacteroidota bacterium]|nr:phospho-N-acetylmuramoyl-pentapeptide-transferase [Bacteroidota bacterium]
MLYHLFTYLEEEFNLAGAGLFQFISFRASMALLLSLIISLFYGKRIIKYLQLKQISDNKRELGLKEQYDKSATPTMGGVIILLSILIPTLLFADLTNIYVILVIVSTIWLGLLGFIDDYIKVFQKNKAGLKGRTKIIGQVILGIIVGTTLYINSDVVIREKLTEKQYEEQKTKLEKEEAIVEYIDGSYWVEHKSTTTTIPFIKGNELDYSKILKFIGDDYEKWAFLIFIPLIIFILVAVSNGANLTDGLDGLNAGVSAIIVLTLAILAYLSGNTVFSNYLNIMYIPNLGEIVIFSGALLGACIGFLWYNAYPAQVFMGDTGSLTLGGLIAIIAIIIRKELLIPLLCGVFLVESLSVILQVSFFKYTKKKYGVGKRIFKMSPIHHHYQKLNYTEPKIVARFWIIGIALAILTIITLKIR